MSMQQYCLRWNNHQPNFISVFSSLLNSESLVDVTLSAEGRHLQAHKLVLSACSSYFQSLFTINPCQHPIVILKDVKFTDLKVIIDFMYYGEVNVSQDQLPHILKTAEMLKIKGLAEIPVEPSGKNNSLTERAELLTPGDSNWSSNDQKQLSPSPCPLSPGSKRKRLRKLSSGSGSTEKHVDEALHTQYEVTLTPPLGTVIKPDPGGFTPDMNSTPPSQRKSQHDDMRGSSHDSTESDTSHQITLQIPQQDMSVQHNVETSAPMEMPGPSSTTTTQTVAGYQWGIVDHNYPHSFTQATLTLPQELQYSNPPPITTHHSYHQHPTNQICPPAQTGQQQPQMGASSPSSQPPQQQKRKRSVNPQADENFVRALDAVRFGGIGFCKAARMYGVNNRTLWLEYKKRGYPISRLSIKNRLSVKAESNSASEAAAAAAAASATSPPPAEDEGSQLVNNPIAMISGTFIDGRQVEIAAPVLQRSRYFDNALVHTTPISLQGINFDQM